VLLLIHTFLAETTKTATGARVPIADFATLLSTPLVNAAPPTSEPAANVSATDEVQRAVAQQTQHLTVLLREAEESAERLAAQAMVRNTFLTVAAVGLA
jgi:hypothetical protein